MITREELAKHSKITRLNLGQAEKDYLQTIILFILYGEHGKNLVFKGGTALKKCFGLDRFSEDLDFTCNEKFDSKKIEAGLQRFRVEYTKKMVEYKDGLNIALKIKGPLYNEKPHSLCGLVIDVSFRENVILEPEVKRIGRFLEEIPAFDVMAMQEEEILAEKIRAVLSRKAARDVYDLWFLLGKGIDPDKKLITEKFLYYSQVWNFEQLREKIEDKRSIWNSELKLVMNSVVPDFDVVKKEILKKTKRWNL